MRQIPFIFYTATFVDENDQNLAHIGHWELDLKTNSLEWSDEVYRILGENPRAFDPSYETLITMEVIHPDDRTRVVRAHKESLRKNTPCDIEYRLLLKDGSVKYVNERFQTLFDDRGNPAGVMGTVQDITERRQAEEGQREAEERRRVLFEEALDGVCMGRMPKPGSFLTATRPWQSWWTENEKTSSGNRNPCCTRPTPSRGLYLPHLGSSFQREVFIGYVGLWTSQPVRLF
ncbi:MAG: PAS domain-containing protein [Desulfatiglandaceae bacterium]